jgi:predicted metal-dependent hydrolase
MDGRLNNIDYSITDGFKPIELPKPMKTALQELIEYLEVNDRKFTYTYKKAIELLEKEKEQIIEAGNACSIKTIVHKEKLDEMSENELRDSLVEDTISYGEEYYNQTYNQNELPKTYINGVEVDSNNSSVTTTGVWTPKTN